MKQIWPTYAYSPTTNVLTLTGLNIDRDQLLLVAAPERGRIMYNFADSSVTASAFTSGANTALTLVATTAGLTTTAALVIYFDDQATSNTVTGTVELGPTSLNALESITVTMGQVTVTGGLTDVQLRASAVTVGGTVTVGNSVTISSLPAISGTVTANIFGFDSMNGGQKPLKLDDEGALFLSSSQAIALATGTNRIGVVTIGAGTVTIGAGTAQIGSVTASISGTVPISISSVTIGNTVTISGTVTANPTGTQTIAGTVTANAGDGFPAVIYSGILQYIDSEGAIPVNIGSALPAGTNRIGVVTIGAGTVTIGAGTAQIGSVTASISGTVPVSISSVTVGNSVTIASFATSVTARLINPAGTAVTYAEVGTAGNPSIDVLSVQGVTSGTPLTILNHQGTAVTTSNFTSTTASTVLASFNATREVLTIFNEGAGNLHICAGATCTTIAYQVRLSAGDYYEVPNHQTTITHSAVFATAGTARVTQVS